MNNPEPDPTTAIYIGAEDHPDVGAPAELLRCLPARNVKHVMSNIGSVRELCEMDVLQVQVTLATG